LIGGNLNDVLIGGQGNDSLTGGGGDDRIWGDSQTFNNDISAESGIDTISGGSGNDTVMGGNLKDYINGNDDDDTIFGEQGDDLIYGGSGNDLIVADRTSGDPNSLADLTETAVGNDYVYGEAGNDTIYGGAMQDMIGGGDGDDYVYGGIGDDLIYGEAGLDHLFGGTGKDRMYGNDGADTMDGGLGDDVLYGGAAFDSLYGSDGDDFLDGEADGAFYHGGLGLDTQADQPIINGLGYNDIFQQGSTSCWFLAALGAMTTLGATGNGTNLSTYLKYVGDGDYEVRLYQKKKWKTVTVNFEGVSSTNPSDALVVNNGDWSGDNQTCEGEFWATVIHRGMLKLYGVDYTSEAAITNANFGYGAGKGGFIDEGLSLLGNTTVTYESPSFFNPFNGSFMNRMFNLLHRTNPIQPILVAASTSPGSNKVVGSHAYQVIEVYSNGITLRNPWGADGGVRPPEDPVNDGMVFLTYAEFASSFNRVAYTTWSVRV
jgi:Ca2+-binding RTX toxin-like protein